jgi:hypothetical protein
VFWRVGRPSRPRVPFIKTLKSLTYRGDKERSKYSTHLKKFLPAINLWPGPLTLSTLMSPKKPKKNPTFGNGDKRKATGQCRSTAQKNASNKRKKK